MTDQKENQKFWTNNKLSVDLIISDTCCTDRENMVVIAKFG